MAILATAAGSGAGHPVWHLVLPAVASGGVFAGLKIREHWQVHLPSTTRGPLASRPASNASRLFLGHQRQAGLWPRPAAPIAALAVASAAASAIHAAVCPAHFREAPAFGVFFLVASALQAVWAVLVLRQPGRTLLILGAVGNLAVVLLWTMSRTIGVPIGPEVWRPEAITATDSLATTLELAVIAGVPWFLSRQHPDVRPSVAAQLPATVGAA